MKMDLHADVASVNKNRIISFLFVSGFIFLIGAVNYSYSESDFNLEARVKAVPSVQGAHDLEIAKFEIHNNNEGYKQMCPSLQCKIDYKGKYTFFSPPDIPQSDLIWAKVDFTLHDDITHADLGPKKKQLVEEYEANLFCVVGDIVEKNWQELYYCHTTGLKTGIFNKFDHRRWDYNTTGIYDAKNNTVNMSSNFTGLE